MFSQACVKNSVQEVGRTSQVGVHGRGRACQGACVAGGHAWQRVGGMSGGGMHGSGCAWQWPFVTGEMHGKGCAWLGVCV